MSKSKSTKADKGKAKTAPAKVTGKAMTDKASAKAEQATLSKGATYRRQYLARTSDKAGTHAVIPLAVAEGADTDHGLQLNPALVTAGGLVNPKRGASRDRLAALLASMDKSGLVPMWQAKRTAYTPLDRRWGASDSHVYSHADVPGGVLRGALHSTVKLSGNAAKRAKVDKAKTLAV